MATLGESARIKLENLGDLLRDWRQASDRTPSDLADITPERLQKIEFGDPPTPRELVYLAHKYSADFQELLEVGWPQLEETWVEIPDTLDPDKLIIPDDVATGTVPSFVRWCRMKKVNLTRAFGSLLPQNLARKSENRSSFHALNKGKFSCDIGFASDVFFDIARSVKGQVNERMAGAVKASYSAGVGIPADVLLAIGNVAQIAPIDMIRRCYPHVDKSYPVGPGKGSYRAFGLAIRTVRESRKMFQWQVAKKMNTTQSQISRFEIGHTIPPFGTLIHLEKVLDVLPGTFTYLIPWRTLLEKIGRKYTRSDRTQNQAPATDSPFYLADQAQFLKELEGSGKNGMTLDELLKDFSHFSIRTMAKALRDSARWERRRPRTNGIQSPPRWYRKGTFVPKKGGPGKKIKNFAIQAQAADASPVSGSTRPPEFIKAETVTLFGSTQLEAEIKRLGGKATVTPVSIPGLTMLFMVEKVP